MSADLLERNLKALSRSELVPVLQDDSLACYAPRLEKRESALDFSSPAISLERRIRAFDPWPGTTARLNGTTMRIVSADVQAVTSPAGSGAVLQADPGGIVVQTGEGQLRILKLQKPGGRALTAAEFLNGNPLGPDARFESD